MSDSVPSPDHHSLELLQPLLAQKALLPLLPVLYVAWSDGDLGNEEIDLVRQLARTQPWIDVTAAAVLDEWLSPDAPPSPVEVQCLLHAIKNMSESFLAPEDISLADLGIELAHAGGLDEEPGWSEDELRIALNDLEQVLGVVGEEATREMAQELSPKQAPVHEIRAPSFDVAAMTRRLDGDYTKIRNEVRELLAGPEFEFVYGLDLPAYREEVMKWVGALADAGFGEKCFPERKGDDHPNMGEFLAIFETLGFFDLNLPVKFGVQYGLFGGSIFFLGTEDHHKKYLPRVASLELQGCYAMTEMGRGSNVRDLETLARYDEETGEFVIQTPSESARKEWIGGAGHYATMATVYAQLEVGGENYGVHAFLVPIRDENGMALPGVTLEDQGLKMGLNGVDNGRLWFDNVRVPRENLLDRYGQVTEDGEYTCPIPSSNRRFFTMLGTLVACRLGVAAAGLSAAKT
ncbi:MAG: acyl-CoA dehydrogenase family protein, partial [Bradymonadaceae bacterium]